MSSKPLNVLFLFSDQHSKEKTGCYGNAHVQTPYIDALASAGVRFSNAYTNCPICVPARASLATGRYVHQLQLWDNASPYIGGTPSWGHRLLSAGRQVTTIGKLHYRYPSDDTGFPDQRSPLHVRDGIGDLFGALREPAARKPGLGRSVTEAHCGESTYTRFDRQVAADACDFLRSAARAGEQPWALQVGFVLPHFPFICPQEYWDRYDPSTLPLPKQYGKSVRHEHPACKDLRHYMGIEEEFPEDVIMRAVRAYYGMCSFVDNQIGRVLNTLAETGLQESTLVIYSSDHGEMLGDHGLWYKNCMFEGAVGIPLILHGPGVPEGRVVDEIVSLVDLFPTILDAAGVDPQPEDSDLPGQSLLPIARGDATAPRVAFSEFHASGSQTAGFMLRKGRYKYIYYVGYPPQLFDLKDDPNETHDIAHHNASADVMADLDRELRKLVDPEFVDTRAKACQSELLERHGGRAHIRDSFKPVIYSPVETA